MKITVALLSMGVLCSAAAQASTVSCSSNSIFVVGMGYTEAKVSFNYTPNSDSSGAASLQNVNGKIEFPDYGAKTFADAAANAAANAASNASTGLPASVNDNDLVGAEISMPLSTANASYRPTPQYRDYFQFKDLKTSDIEGYSEGLLDLTVMIPKSSFSRGTTAFKMTAEVQIDQNAGRVVLNCKVN